MPITMAHAGSPGLVGGAAFGGALMRNRRKYGVQAAQFADRAIQRRDQRLKYAIDRRDRLADKQDRIQLSLMGQAAADARQQSANNLRRELAVGDATNRFMLANQADKRASLTQEGYSERQEDQQAFLEQQQIQKSQAARDEAVLEGLSSGEWELPETAPAELKKLENDRVTIANDKTLSPEKRQKAFEEIEARRLALLRTARPAMSDPAARRNRELGYFNPATGKFQNEYSDGVITYLGEKPLDTGSDGMSDEKLRQSRMQKAEERVKEDRERAKAEGRTPLTTEQALTDVIAEEKEYDRIVNPPLSPIAQMPPGSMAAQRQVPSLASPRDRGPVFDPRYGDARQVRDEGVPQDIDAVAGRKIQEMYDRIRKAADAGELSEQQAEYLQRQVGLAALKDQNRRRPQDGETALRAATFPDQPQTTEQRAREESRLFMQREQEKKRLIDIEVQGIRADMNDLENDPAIRRAMHRNPKATKKAMGELRRLMLEDATHRSRTGRPIHESKQKRIEYLLDKLYEDLQEQSPEPRASLGSL